MSQYSTVGAMVGFVGFCCCLTIPVAAQRPSNNRHPSLSPSGEKITFDSDREGNSDIFVMNADGSNLTQLTRDPSNDALALWSPDGSSITFSSTRGDRSPTVYRMDADGSNVRIVEDPDRVVDRSGPF